MPIILDSQLLPGADPTGSTAGGLVRELGMRMEDYAEGIVSTLSTDTNYLDDNTRIEPSDVFRAGWLSYTASPTSIAINNNTIERRITGYDGELNRGRFLIGNGALGAGLLVPAQVGDTYRVHMRWSKRRKLAAINRAIRRLPQNFWRRIEDTAIQTLDRTWTYPLPAGMTNLFEVWIQSSTNLSGPGPLGQGQDGRGFPFERLYGWSIRSSVDTSGLATRVLQLADLPPFPRVLRLIGTGTQPVLLNDTDIIAVGQDDYDQRLQEYLLSYANAYLWLEGADGAPVDQAQRSTELVKLNMQVAAELRNDLVMPPPALEFESPATVGRRGLGDNAYYLAALHTPSAR